MKRRRNSGITLIELIFGVLITGMIAATAAALLSTTLRAHSYGTETAELYREGKYAMDRMTAGVRSTVMVMIPNNHKTVRDLLAISDMKNDDNDFYFGDPLFPRIDEDLDERFGFASYGVSSYDDDGDGAIDEGGQHNEDEDDLTNEELWNGIDEDGDGNIDEDINEDMNNDGEAGIAGIDDDGDGQIDEGTGNAHLDDDEDGVQDEEAIGPIVYEFRAGPGELWERAMDPDSTGWTLSETLLASNVTAFTTTFETPERILITLTLTGDDGESVTFSEYAYVRNVIQRNGKRVK
jgi:hypothetical protein